MTSDKAGYSRYRVGNNSDIYSLLSLSADVLGKFVVGNDCWETIKVFHLGKTHGNNKAKYGEVLEQCRSIHRDTTSTVFVLLSPQFLVKHANARKVFLRAADKCNLRVVVMDEIHLFV